MKPNTKDDLEMDKLNSLSVNIF